MNSLLQRYIMWGNLVIIPESLHKRLLDEIHMGHLDIVRMKSYARLYAGCQTLTGSRTKCRSCTGCLSVQNQPTGASVHPWDWPETPWYRLHIDYSGPF